MTLAPETGLDWRHDRVVLPCILVFAALMSIKYFTGLENSGYYAGFTMSTIHPELLNSDPIVGKKVIGASSPYLLTIYHLFPKFLGELWLDDRVVVVVYLISVALSFLAVDRIAVALGAFGLWERLIILMLFLKDHMILENSVNLAHHPDFNHSALAIPIALWLIWSVVRGKRLAVVLALSALLVSTSLLVGPYTVGLALVAVALTGHGKERVIAASLVAAGVIAAFYVLFFHLQVPGSDRLGLWNILVNHLYEGMVAPFDPRFNGTAFVVLGSTVFAGVLAIVLFWPAPANHGLAAARAIIGTAALAWIVLGLYGQYAPEWARYPQLIMLPITRQLQYPQILAFIGAFVIMMRWARPTPRTGPGPHRGSGDVSFGCRGTRQPGSLDRAVFLGPDGEHSALRGALDAAQGKRRRDHGRGHELPPAIRHRAGAHHGDRAGVRGDAKNSGLRIPAGYGHSRKVEQRGMGRRRWVGARQHAGRRRHSSPSP